GPLSTPICPVTIARMPSPSRRFADSNAKKRDGPTDQSAWTGGLLLAFLDLVAEAGGFFVVLRLDRLLQARLELLQRIDRDLRLDLLGEASKDLHLVGARVH